MKKLLMLILILLLLALSIFIVLNGFQIGEVDVLSFTGIQEENEKLDQKIQEASKLVEKDYKQAVSDVNSSSKKLEQTKKEYEEMTMSSSEGDIQAANQIQKYEVETLWVKLGNYATSEGAVMKMDIVRGNTNETYNLKFTVNGSYISITDFISDIENDSTLGFKIEEFKMVPGSSTSDLKATFVCKEIAIKDISSTTSINSNNTTQVDWSSGNVVNNDTSNTTNSTTQSTTNTNTQAGNTNVVQ